MSIMAICYFFLLNFYRIEKLKFFIYFQFNYDKYCISFYDIKTNKWLNTTTLLPTPPKKTNWIYTGISGNQKFKIISNYISSFSFYLYLSFHLVSIFIQCLYPKSVCDYLLMPVYDSGKNIFNIGFMARTR